ncbi:hypothetical protein FFI94_033325 [Rhodococcus sp. KBS0724]|uniref:LysR substrate-binding domain-containing protein n=1 Tax=Rhodococcus sp. KBS0724 TaxID=1179674 RepID=UPI00110F64DC|nr:LysR substrate-binding domain-containing protein [Rhodococcus sp. KBS0724]TSD39684.1 hypothetical protein FFI94_033325 [Rhodococcus sp. KBS0724]
MQSIALLEAGIEPTIRYEVSEYSTQLALVEAGLAVALVPETARAKTAGVRYLPTEPAVTRSLRAASSTRIPAVGALLDALNSILSK